MAVVIAILASVALVTYLLLARSAAGHTNALS